MYNVRTPFAPATVGAEEERADNKVRVQLDFSRRDFKEIQGLVTKLDLPTRAELFRSALMTLRWIVAKKEAGCTIVAVTPDDRLLEPEFEFLRHFGSAYGAAEVVHNSLSAPVVERSGVIAVADGRGGDEVAEAG